MNRENIRNWITAGSAIFIIIAVFCGAGINHSEYGVFRVIENLYSGKGLVFNPEVTRESFSAPLWILFLTLIRATGAGYEVGTLILGGFFYITGLLFLLHRTNSSSIRPFPVALIALVSYAGFREISLSGAEFPLTFFLLTLFYAESEQATIKEKPFYFGSLLSLLYLNGPIWFLLILYYTLILIFNISKNKTESRKTDRIRPLISWIAGIFIPAGSYHIFRFVYFGTLFPPKTVFAAEEGIRIVSGVMGFLSLIPESFSILLLVIFTAYILFRNRPDHLNLFDMLPAVILFIMAIITGGKNHSDYLPAFVVAALVIHRFFEENSQWPGQILSGNKRDITVARIEIVVLIIAALPIFIPAGTGSSTVTAWSTIRSAVSNTKPFPESKAIHYLKLKHCLHYDPIILKIGSQEKYCTRTPFPHIFAFEAGPELRIIMDDRVNTIGNDQEKSDDLHQSGGKITFCSTGDSEIDRVLTTPYGVLQDLNPGLFASLPDATERLASLNALYNANHPALRTIVDSNRISFTEWSKEIRRLQSDKIIQLRKSCWVSPIPIPGNPR